MSTDRLNDIFIKLGEMETHASGALARIEGEITRVGDKLGALDEKVRIQNGRVTKLENTVGDLQVSARIQERDAKDADERQDTKDARAWAFISGAALVGLAAALGHFL